MVTNITGSSGLNIYYDAGLSANTYLAGLTYDLTGGGRLIAVGWEEPILEPSTMLLLGTGLLGLARMRRKKEVKAIEN